MGKPETHSHNAKDNEATPQPLTTRMACVWPLHTYHPHIHTISIKYRQGATPCTTLHPDICMCQRFILRAWAGPPQASHWLHVTEFPLACPLTSSSEEHTILSHPIPILHHHIAQRETYSCCTPQGRHPILHHPHIPTYIYPHTHHIMIPTAHTHLHIIPFAPPPVQRVQSPDRFGMGRAMGGMEIERDRVCLPKGTLGQPVPAGSSVGIIHPLSQSMPGDVTRPGRGGG